MIQTTSLSHSATAVSIPASSYSRPYQLLAAMTNMVGLWTGRLARQVRRLSYLERIRERAISDRSSPGDPGTPPAGGVAGAWGAHTSPHSPLRVVVDAAAGSPPSGRKASSPTADANGFLNRSAEFLQARKKRAKKLRQRLAGKKNITRYVTKRAHVGNRSPCFTRLRAYVAYSLTATGTPTHGEANQRRIFGHADSHIYQRGRPQTRKRARRFVPLISLEFPLRRGGAAGGACRSKQARVPRGGHRGGGDLRRGDPRQAGKDPREHGEAPPQGERVRPRDPGRGGHQGTPSRPPIDPARGGHQGTPSRPPLDPL
eukprot:1194315-Prorocentrum_minimum.AAC.4